jgi:drug/metabolite transporter (DMT)-like permease
VIGLIPLATAIGGSLRVREQPSPQFWIASITGSCLVVSYAVIQGNGGVQVADLALVGAVISAAWGYTEGGWLAQEMGGWQVICWALVLVAPFVSLPMLVLAWHHGLEASLSAWVGFSYLCTVSQFLAFFAWYHGLAIGGIARISQIKLLQPFLTILVSGMFLDEPITGLTIGVAMAVAITVLIGRHAAIGRNVRDVTAYNHPED